MSKYTRNSKLRTSWLIIWNQNKKAVSPHHIGLWRRWKGKSFWLSSHTSPVLKQN